jgi:hypothetical protein
VGGTGMQEAVKGLRLLYQYHNYATNILKQIAAGQLPLFIGGMSKKLVDQDTHTTNIFHHQRRDKNRNICGYQYPGLCKSQMFSFIPDLSLCTVFKSVSYISHSDKSTTAK